MNEKTPYSNKLEHNDISFVAKIEEIPLSKERKEQLEARFGHTTNKISSEEDYAKAQTIGESFRADSRSNLTPSKIEDKQRSPLKAETDLNKLSFLSRFAIRMEAMNINIMRAIRNLTSGGPKTTS